MMTIDVSRLRTLPGRSNVDVLVGVSPENFAYISGAYVVTVTTVRPRLAFAILTASGEAATVVCSIEKSTMEDESWITDIRTYTEFLDEPIDALCDALADMGQNPGRLGIDLSYLPQASYARLAERLPRAEIVDTSDDVAAVRAIKFAEEIDILERTAKITHRAIVRGMSQSRQGDTEKTMCDNILVELLRGGAIGIDFVCFASGSRTRMPHAQPTNRVPEESEIIRFDLGGEFGQWTSDMARTYSTGNPTAQQRETYRLLCEAQEETIRSLRPGLLAEDIYFTCKAEFDKRGLEWWLPHVGHSFGIELHEKPMLRPGDKTVLKPGMVLNIEPLVFDGDGNGYHVEDLLTVTEDGYRLLTYGLAPKELPVIGQPVADVAPGMPE